MGHHSIVRIVIRNGKTFRFLWDLYIIPELQNQATHNDVTSRVANSIFFQFFELANRCEKTLI